MKIVRIEPIGTGQWLRQRASWQKINQQVIQAIRGTDWPHGTGKFSIFPQSGKKRGEGNGVVPIKYPCISALVSNSWKAEAFPQLPPGVLTPGDFDAMITIPEGNVVFEWETGNISSSHRAINKILATLGTVICSAYLVLPNKELAKYLTDRIGNFEELMPYFDLFRRECPDAPFDIISITYDEISSHVPKIPKGNDGRAII